ncbi:TonB-dependent receptor plug domain-containing protein [Sphingomonas sp. MMS24-JH45]
MDVSQGLQRLIGTSGLRLVSFDGRTAAPRRRPGDGRCRPADRAPAGRAGAADGTAPVEVADNQLDDIVVTGTRARGQTVLTSSSAITVASQDLDRKAPRSTAQALELVPGIFVEGSGGEAVEVFSVRGLAAAGSSSCRRQEDSLPVFYINALSDTILKQEVYIDRLEAVRSGMSGILTVNGSGATINFITRKPISTSRAALSSSPRPVSAPRELTPS